MKIERRKAQIKDGRLGNESCRKNKSETQSEHTLSLQMKCKIIHSTDRL